MQRSARSWNAAFMRQRSIPSYAPLTAWTGSRRLWRHSGGDFRWSDQFSQKLLLLLQRHECLRRSLRDRGALARRPEIYHQQSEPNRGQTGPGLGMGPEEGRELMRDA